MHAMHAFLLAAMLLLCTATRPAAAGDGDWVDGRATFYDDNQQGSCKYRDQVRLAGGHARAMLLLTPALVLTGERQSVHAGNGVPVASCGWLLHHAHGLRASSCWHVRLHAISSNPALQVPAAYGAWPDTLDGFAG
jgi:hypothetical protein